MPRTDNPERLRSFLAENPDHPQAPEIKRRIEELEAERALADGTAYALRSYISRYPHSASAIKVREKLQQLDWEKAKAADTEKVWTSFLLDWPNGPLADKARERLIEIKCERLLKDGTLEELEASARSERLPCRDQLRQCALDWRYLQAVSSPCCDQLVRFLRRYGQSEQARQLRRMLAGWRVEELLSAARFELAFQVAEKYAPEDKGIRESIRRRSDLWQLASKLADWLEDFHLPFVAEEALSHSCHRAFWARELSVFVDERAASELFELVEDPFLEVRREAVLGLRRVLKNLGKARAAGWLDERLSQLDEASAPAYKIALLRWFAGEKEESLSLLRAINSQNATGDVFALWMMAMISSELAGHALLAPVQEFRRAASAFASGRMKVWEDTRQKDGESASSVMRQLCALARLWREVESTTVPVPEEEGQESGQITLRRLEDWLEEKEKALGGISTSCPPCLGEISPMAKKWRLSPEKIARLAMAPSAWTSIMLDAIACGHPEEELRKVAFCVRALGVVMAPVLPIFAGHWLGE